MLIEQSHTASGDFDTAADFQVASSLIFPFPAIVCRVQPAKGGDGWRKWCIGLIDSLVKQGSDQMESSGWKRVMEQDKNQKCYVRT